MPTVHVFAIGSPYVEEARESLQRLGWEVAAWIQNRPGETPDLTPQPLQAEQLTDDALAAHPAVVPLVTPGHRRTAVAELEARGAHRFAVVVDPTTTVASTAVLGDGCYVNAAGVIGARTTLGQHVLINRSVSIGHHCVLDDYATMGPGAMLCGSCSIGRGAFIGAGAIITPEVTVGANAVVGAGAVVTRDVPANTLVFGNPAQVVREDVAGYNDVGVAE